MPVLAFAVFTLNHDHPYLGGEPPKRPISTVDSILARGFLHALGACPYRDEYQLAEGINKVLACFLQVT
jgi:hypothetical protein